MKKIVIIGCKGFIGKNVYDFFAGDPAFDCWGADVVVDYISTNYYLIDSTNSDFNELFETHSFDFCLNCSGAASVPDSLLHPLRDFSLNTYNAIKMLDSIKRHNPQCVFINMSSAAIYGNPALLPINEEDECNPVSPYGLHKLITEKVCHEYHQYFGLKTCSLRIFSAYGPGLKKQILWDVYQKSIGSDSVSLFGTGDETRDFIFITDIINAIKIIIEKGDFNAAVYNVASGVEVSIKEVAMLFLGELNYKGKIIFTHSERKGDPVNWKANVERITSIGFQPSVTIHEGIKKYVEWLREEKLL